MKQVFKHKVLTRTKVKNNILKVWRLTDQHDRYDWYNEALGYATLMTAPHPAQQINVNQACGIISALSPRKHWEVNKRIARQFVIDQDMTKIPATKMFASKANDILHCDGKEETILKILNGRKLVSFYLNI